MNMEFIRKLPIPKELKAQFSLSEKLVNVKAKRDAEIKKVFTGESDKKLLIIGPCSADREDAVLDYVSRLAKVQEKVQDKLLLIPRIYTNKPRTTGEGYKGMVHQPDPEKKEDMLQGLIAIRELHTRAIEQTGLTCADEMLYPENHRYLSDLLSYVAIGARSVENQQHRLTASGLDIPGLDYWDKLDLTYYTNWEDFCDKNPEGERYFFTTKGRHIHSDVSYPTDKPVYLVFGREDKGLNESLLVQHPDTCVRIPMRNTLRSLNLSNSVAIAAYEVLRQWEYPELSVEGELTQFTWE